MTFGARARIRPGAITHNLDIVRRAAPGTKVMAVVKGNAYGHGLVQAATALAGADSLAVARLSEARDLRDAGVSTPVVLLAGVLSGHDLIEAVGLGLQLCVHDEQQLEWLEAYRGSVPMLWIKVDTGMHRLGFHADEVKQAMQRAARRAARTGLMTQLACADDIDDPATPGQIDAFARLSAGFDGDFSIANSPGILAWADAYECLAGPRDEGRLWIRPGLSLYGISPFAGSVGVDVGLRPAMCFEATLASVRQIDAGSRVGYGGSWKAPRDTMLGIVAAGYADGYSRHIPSGTPVLVNGRRVPVAGRISMDLMAVDLGPDADDRAGDRVMLWGDGLPVEEVALHAGTIPYDLLTGVTHREAALYED